MEREKDARPLPSLPSTGFPKASSGSGQTGKGAGEDPEDGATAPPPVSPLGESDAGAYPKLAVMETLGDGMGRVREYPFSPIARGGADRRNKTGCRTKKKSYCRRKLVGSLPWGMPMVVVYR
jgi:hypothetical protein